MLTDIYEKNQMGFAVGKESVCVFPSAAARQGDALSAPVFYLNSMSIARARKSNLNAGLLLYGSNVKTTASADDMAVITNSPSSSN
jgi:hypothetical protein